MDDSRLFAERLIAIEARLAALEARPSIPAAIDGLGAPLNPQQWPELREAVKAAIGEIGLEEAARRYGATAETFRDLVYRRRRPSAGTRARLALIVGGKD